LFWFFKYKTCLTLSNKSTGYIKYYNLFKWLNIVLLLLLIMYNIININILKYGSYTYYLHYLHTIINYLIGFKSPKYF